MSQEQRTDIPPRDAHFSLFFSPPQHATTTLPQLQSEQPKEKSQSRPR